MAKHKNAVAEKHQLAVDRCDPKKMSARHKRWREFTDGRGRKRQVMQVHLKAAPERVKAHPGFYCPAGPGRRPVSADGRWYDLTDFLRKRLRSGDVVTCAPAEAKPKTKTKTAAEKPASDGESK
jgi:hypothetical protein